MALLVGAEAGETVRAGLVEDGIEGVDEFGAAAVVQRQNQPHAGVAGGRRMPSFISCAHAIPADARSGR